MRFPKYPQETRFRYPYNMPRDLANPPFNNLRDHTYPKFPGVATQAIAQAVHGGTFPKPWLNRSVMYGRTPNTAYNAITATMAQDALLRAANGSVVTYDQAAALLNFNAPVAEPRVMQGPIIRQVPSTPRSNLPTEGFFVQAAMQNPTRRPSVDMKKPDVDQLARKLEKGLYRKSR